MASNHKLTSVIQGRTISKTAHSGDVLIVTFSDGSEMTVKTSKAATVPETKGTVEKVRQETTPPTLHLDLQGGDSTAIPLAEATSSVFLRDKTGAMEYAD